MPEPCLERAESGTSIASRKSPTKCISSEDISRQFFSLSEIKEVQESKLETNLEITKENELDSDS